MPAFTHLCSKVNISLFDDTLTFYPKKNGKIHFELLLSPWGLMLMQMECEYAEVSGLCTYHDTELGVTRFVHREDPDHLRYHADSFPMDNDHIHAQFAKTISAEKLEEICRILVKYDVITETEKECFLQAYHQANDLKLEGSEATRQAEATTDVGPSPLATQMLAAPQFSSLFFNTATPLFTKNATPDSRPTI